MPSLGRPTETGDAVPLFDFETYFLGKWSFEWSMPESALGPAGPYTGTTTVSKLDGRFYEAVSEGEGPAGPFKVREIIAYHRENKTLARTVTDSRGFNYFQLGPVGGDLGGIYNIHFESAPFTVNGKSVRLRHTLHLLSPLNYRMATAFQRMAVPSGISGRRGGGSAEPYEGYGSSARSLSSSTLRSWARALSCRPDTCSG